MNEVIWLSVSCWVEEGWSVNTKEFVSHACFHGGRAGSFSSPLCRELYRKEPGRKTLKIFLHARLPW